MKYLLKNALVVTLDDKNTVLPEADILVSEGQIQAVGPGLTPGAGEPAETLELAGKMVIPGLINAHSHAYANLVKGMGDLLPLEPWMYYAMLAGKLTRDEVRIAALLQVIENLRNGCTAFVDHLAREYAGLDTALATYAETGVRAAVAPMISDRRYDQGLPFGEGDLTAEEAADFSQVKPRPAAEILAECEELICKWHGFHDLLRVMPGPSGPQRCSDELLTGSYELAEKYDVGFHTHLLETRIQAETAYHLWGKSMVEHLSELGILSERVSLAHSVWLTDREIELLAGSGASVVHNPVSNLTLGSGIAPLIKFRRAGVNIALGTDGSNCGGSQSLFQSLRLAAVLPRIGTPVYEEWPGASEVLRMATAGGARVLRAEDKLGSLAPGKAADLVVIDLKRTTYQPLNDPLQQLVYGETGSGVEMVMVAGRILLAQGRLTTVDEEAVLAEACQVAASLSRTKGEWLEQVKGQYRAVERLYRKLWKLN